MAALTLSAPAATRRPAVRRPAPRPAAPGRRAPARRTPLRLTRRGRVVVLMVLVLASFVLLSAGRGAASQATTAVPAAPVATSVVVQPGQTLWAIARDLDPSADPRATIERLRELNSLKGDRLVAGQSLLVPARG